MIKDNITLKVGDRVIIRKDLSVFTNHPPKPRVTSHMAQLRGEIATITYVDWDGDYHIDIDRDNWYWSNYMFETKLLDFIDD